MELRPRHFRAIELLAATDLEKREVASAVGVSRGTLTRWLRDKAFQQELALRRELLPCRLEALRMQAARRALMDLVDRLTVRFDRAPMKEVTQLLGQLVSEDFEFARPAASAVAEAQPSALSAADADAEKPDESAPAP